MCTDIYIDMKTVLSDSNKKDPPHTHTPELQAIIPPNIQIREREKKCLYDFASVITGFAEDKGTPVF